MKLEIVLAIPASIDKKKSKQFSNTRVNPYSAGIDFSRQNLTSSSSKVDPGTVSVKIFILAVDP